MANSFIIVYVLAIFTLTNGFHSGGPYYVCKSLVPGHNDEYQTASAPYKLSLSRSSVELGGSTSVTVQSTGVAPFMGFMCAASLAYDQSNLTVGTFSLTPASLDMAQLLKCSGSNPNTAVTHTDRVYKEKIGFDWTVPSDATIGSVYKIRCTLVQTFDVYWTNLQVLVTVVGADQNVNTASNGAAVVNIETITTTPIMTGSSNSTQFTTGSAVATQAITGSNGATQGNTGSSNTTQFNVTDKGNVNNSITQDIKGQGQSTGGVSLPPFGIFGSPSTQPSVSMANDNVNLNSSAITESPMGRPDPLSNNFSSKLTPDAQNNSLNESSNATLVVPSQTPNSSNNTSNKENNFTGRPNFVPNLILLNPTSFFLTSWNIHNSSSETGALRRKKESRHG